MNNRLYKLMNWPQIEEIIYSECDNPFAILGPHKAGNQTLIQAFLPEAENVSVVIKGTEEEFPMEKADEDGFFATLVPYSSRKLPEYSYRITDAEGHKRNQEEVYRFDSLFTKKELERFSSGIFYEAYAKLGAHKTKNENADGVMFAVWAPNALRVSVVGDFNHWDGRIHQMRKHKKYGVFELFIPDISVGMNYKFECKLQNGSVYLKADPYCNEMQLRPDNASVITDSSFEWDDAAFLSNRASFQNKTSPINIYEIFPDKFTTEDGSAMNYREMADVLATKLTAMRFTHVELTPIMDYPDDKTKGTQVLGYFAPTKRYGSPDDLKYFVNTMHKAHIGVILDWVPCHFPKDDYGLINFDGTCLYEHRDDRQRCHPYLNTVLFNYGRPEVSNFLISSALYWVEQYHADGIRLEGVAGMLYLDYCKQEGNWVPNMYGGNENLDAIEFLKHMNSILKKRNPGVITIAEDISAFPGVTADLNKGGLGFDYKWNNGMIRDYLDFIIEDPCFRSGHYNKLTFSMVYQYAENFLLSLSHTNIFAGNDVLYDKMPGIEKEKEANLRLTYAYFMLHPGKKMLLDHKEMDAKTTLFFKDINTLYMDSDELNLLDQKPEGFAWINQLDSQRCILSFVRKAPGKDKLLLVVVNFAGIEQNITIGVPMAGKYKEIINTDDKRYGGTGVVNCRVKNTKKVETDGFQNSISLKLGALSLSVLRYSTNTKKEK